MMKRTLLLTAVAAASVLGIDAMADATQNRPDKVEPGTRTTLVFDVASRRYNRGESAAAHALWGVCAGTFDNDIVQDLTFTDEGWEVVIEPALGEHSEKRLTGCLTDVTIDRVLGRVVAIETTPAP